MAETKNPIPMQAADKSDAIICAVTRDGKTFLNTDADAAEDMPPKVKDLLDQPPRQDRFREGRCAGAV